MKYIKFFNLLCFSMLSACQSNYKSTIDSFVRDLSDVKIVDSIVKRHYMFINNAKIHEENTLTDLQLDFLRKQILSNKSVPVVKPYADLPANDQNILIDNNIRASYIYGIVLNGKLLTLVLVKNGKIASISTINKGGRRVFLLL